MTRDLGETLTRWDRLRGAGDDDTDARAEAATADELEGLATRLQAVVLSSDRLRGVEALTQAIAAFQGTSNEQGWRGSRRTTTPPRSTRTPAAACSAAPSPTCSGTTRGRSCCYLSARLIR